MTEASFPPPQRFSNGRVSLEAVGRTDVGRRRAHNEDTLGLLPVAYEGLAHQRGYVFAVADGMGGAEKGEVASHLAVEALFAAYYDDSEPDLPPQAALRAAFATANSVVYNEGLNLSYGMMGTTLVAVVVVDDRVIVGNVGDSRAYLIRDGALRQLSEDHSLVEEQVRAGLLSPAQARQSPQRNIITRAIGHQPQVEDDQYQVAPLQPGDLLLLCSDGLHGMIEDQDLLALALQPDLAQAAGALIAAANDRGGHDNITTLLIRILSVEASAQPREQTQAFGQPRRRDTTPTLPGLRPPPDPAGGRGSRALGVAGAVVAVGAVLALGAGLLAQAAGFPGASPPTPTPFAGMRVSGRVDLPESIAATPLGMYVAVEGPAAQRLSARVASDASYQIELPPGAPEGTYTLSVRPEQVGVGDAPASVGGSRRVAVYRPRSVALARGSAVMLDLPYEIVEERHPLAGTTPAPAGSIPR